MATELERLIVALEARTKAFETALAKANATANKRATDIEKRFQKVNKTVSASLGDIGGAFTRAFAVAGSLRGAQQLIDASIKIDNALKTTGLSGEALTSVYDKLFASAQKNAAPIEALVDVYSKASLVQSELGASSEDLIKFTDNVALALRASGKSSEEAGGALLQLGQALGSATVRAEEYNSIQEGAPTILKAVANGLTAAGGSVSKLRALVIAGKVSNKEFFESFQRGSVVLEKMVNGSALTIDQGFTRLKNTLIDTAGRLDKVTGASTETGNSLARMAGVIDTLASAVEAFAGSPAGKLLGFLDSVVKKFEPINAALNVLADKSTADAFKNLTPSRDFAAELENARQEIDKLFDRIEKAGDAGILSDQQIASFKQLRQQLRDGKIDADGASKAIASIAAGNPGLAELPSKFDAIIAKVRVLIDEANAAADAVAEIGEGGRATGFGMLSQRDASAKFISERTADAKRTDFERDIDTRAKAIIEAGAKVGVAMTEAAAKIQAAKEIAAENVARSTDAVSKSAIDLIKGFESFRSKPYWDVNAYRAGYGSDTVTLDDGSVQKVTQGITVTLAQANRDLERRIVEFQDGIRNAIGADTFNSMDEAQQAALTSIAYNYGSLPQRIVDAIKSGNQATVVQAIRGLGVDNGGINRDRRNSEADLFLGGAPTGVRKAVRGQDSYKASLADIQQRILLLQQEAAAQGALNPLVNDYGFAVEKARIVQELLNDAQANGIEITPELKTKIDALAEQYARASAAGDQLADSQGRLKDRMSESSALGKDVLGGFIRDLRDGKSAADALANALEKIADKLLDMALTALFDGTGGVAGGGILGGLFSWLPKLFGFAKGGIAAHGKPLKTFARGGVSRSAAIFGEKGPEAAVPLPDGRSIPVRFSGLRGSGYGGRDGGRQVYNIPIKVSADGADAGQIALLRKQLRELQASIPRMVDARTRQRELRGTRA